MTFLRGLRSTIVFLALAACVVLALVMLAPAVAGYDRYVITSGSMTGTYDRGSIVYAKTVPVGELRVGDTITYAPPPGMSPTELVTHRIARIKQSARGPVFRTKGDANEAIDPWRFTLQEPTQARVAFSVPYVGFLVAALSDRNTRMIVIGIPALLVAFVVLFNLAADMRRYRRQQQPAAAPAG